MLHFPIVSWLPHLIRLNCRPGDPPTAAVQRRSWFVRKSARRRKGGWLTGLGMSMPVVVAEGYVLLNDDDDESINPRLRASPLCLASKPTYPLLPPYPSFLFLSAKRSESSAACLPDFLACPWPPSLVPGLASCFFFFGGGRSFHMRFMIAFS